MEELQILDTKSRTELFQNLYSICGITLPHYTARLGALTFHLYNYTHNFRKQGDYVFHIRWGVHTIFSKKHLAISDTSKILETLTTLIKQNCTKIKHELYRYCEEQLDSLIGLELQPELNAKFPGLIHYKLEIRSGRASNNKTKSLGWPEYKVFLAWTDDFGDFQEFIYPITFDEERKRFEINVDNFLNRFAQYRDAQF